MKCAICNSVMSQVGMTLADFVCSVCQDEYLVDSYGNNLELELKVDSAGNKEWYVGHKLHRLDSPAVEYANGSKYWYVNDKRHRLDGPAIEHINGNKFWYVNDKRHRLDGPAIEWADGTKEWYVNGKRHRLDGPAVECADGHKAYYIEGKKYSYRKWEKKVKEIKKGEEPKAKRWELEKNSIKNFLKKMTPRQEG